MEYHFYHTSSVYRKSKEKRAAAFIRILATIMIVASAIWACITISYKLYPFTLAIIFIILNGFFVLYLIRKEKIQLAKLLILFISGTYFLAVIIFSAGYGVEHDSTLHFWFILLFVLSYFLLNDFRPLIREAICLFFLVLFFLIHYGYFPLHRVIPMPSDQSDILNKVTALTFLITLFFVTRFFVLEITKAESALAVTADQLEGLIESMLPSRIASKLKLEGKTFAEEIRECSVLFADIEGFTSWCEKHTPNEVAESLNTIFSAIDEEVERLGLTKIKTNGDCYIVAAGIPDYRSDHASVLVKMGFIIRRIAEEHNTFQFRIGINSGSAVAGVIGRKNFFYDMWGDTINTASRLESSGETGKINISASTYELVKDKFNCTHRGKIQAKNKGLIDMYFVENPD